MVSLFCILVEFTLTTLGYGDISPNPQNNQMLILTLLCVIEAFSGYGLFGFTCGNLFPSVPNT